ncbi:hypothetical protein U1Q18_028638 [Sarracenia purpurea var. burkii]
MEPTPPLIAEKICNIVKIVFFMLRKGVSKRKLRVDLHLLFKRGKIAGKALGDLMAHHHSSLSCRSNDAHLSFVSPREYEFSCSNSPAYPTCKRHHRRRRNQQYYYGHEDDVNVVQKVFDILTNEVPETSPMFLPGFGRSPTVRQLRITDSPFPLKDAEDQDVQVDKAAEEFIKKFYKELKHQKKMAALGSPSPYHIWAR